MSFDYWFMFPIAIAIATIAMASGVEGATFFTPLFILLLKLPTEVAISTGLITEVFGFSSGLFAYIRKGLIDFKLVIFTAPGVLIGAQLGSIVATRLSQHLLERSMGILFILVGAIVLGELALRNQKIALLWMQQLS
jgi:uncharacterized membrane protein YfcA